MDFLKVRKKKLTELPSVEDQPEKIDVRTLLTHFEKMVSKRVHTNHDWKDGNVIRWVNHGWMCPDWKNIERWNFYEKGKQIVRDPDHAVVVLL